MIYERFRRYSHLPHQVANNGINCHDTKLSKYQNILEHNYVVFQLCSKIFWYLESFVS